MSSATFHKWRTKFGGMEASMTAQNSTLIPATAAQESPHPHLNIIRGLELRDSELTKKGIQSNIIGISTPIIQNLAAIPSTEKFAVH